MALIVEDGTGLATAESYLSVTDADAYHSARGNASWASLAGGTTQKEQLLRRATQYMEGQYRLRWLSYRTTVVQALSWPRAWVPIPDSPVIYGYGNIGSYVANNVVPAEVKSACAELALRASVDDLAPDLSPVTTKETVGPISVEYDSSSSPYTMYRAVDAMLEPYLRGTGMTVGLVRA